MDMKFEESVIQCGRVIVMNDLKQSSWLDGYMLCESKICNEVDSKVINKG